MKISVVAPVLNEVQFIGYSIMACLDEMHEFIYSIDSESNDGTRELLYHIKEKYAHEKLKIIEFPHFDTTDMNAYNDSFRVGLEEMTGDAAMFLHPDQIILNPEKISAIDKDDAMAWWIHLDSYVGDLEHVFTDGRTDKWKNIHRNEFGLHYYGAYGSQNEDFYHRDITNNVYKFHGFEFDNYPYPIKDSGLKANHYCEVKPYDRRLEKMIRCLKTQRPDLNDSELMELALTHPRVTLKPDARWGNFSIGKSDSPIPSVFVKYKKEFDSFKKEVVHA